jgi:hypothetical protein
MDPIQIVAASTATRAQAARWHGTAHAVRDADGRRYAPPFRARRRRVGA